MKIIFISGDQTKNNFQLIEELVTQTVEILLFTRTFELNNLSNLPKNISISVVEVYVEIILMVFLKLFLIFLKLNFISDMPSY